MKPPKFTAEAKELAVKKYLTSTKSCAEIARDLGCSERSLRRWVAVAKASNRSG